MKANDDNQTNIYFIKARDAIKIGIAQDVKKRMNEIQVSNPDKLQLFHLFTVPIKTSREIESTIHYIFRSSQLNGEWFMSSLSLIKFIDAIKKVGWNPLIPWMAENCDIKKSLIKRCSPDSITALLRQWIVTHPEPFTTKDIYNHFHSTTKKAHNNVRVALWRLLHEEKLITKLNKTTYVALKNSDLVSGGNPT